MKNICIISFVALSAIGLAFAAGPPLRSDLTDAVRGAEGLDEALRNLRASMVTTPPLSPTEALARFHLPEGYAIDLIASEPAVRQPLYTTFDERGRMWVVQYVQYPFPAGLKVLSYDRYIRAKFDRVPPPPPEHFVGQDRITIHEDVSRDGSFRDVKTFLSGLSITTAALPGRGGVWVLNPPYLLFYPDPGHTDRPARPVVHLSGFGLEDTHAVASSLIWGPDGWIYGAQGSTCTAKVRVEVTHETKTTDFLGQAIWRYHPEEHRFEIFAEGGGNTFGVAFDDVGRVYSGTNWGVYRGLHYVQGGYYVKGWGKHGPLTNPYAFGFYQHMPHQGNAERLVHDFLVYGGDLMPGLRGKIVGVNALQRRVQVTKLIADRSTFRTEEEPFLVTTDDGRFRPVDVKSGPDGALYVCDLYEPRINHVDPRDNWDRATGRIYRIRPKDYKPEPQRDLGKLGSRELVSLLAHRNRWQRETALRVLGDRKDRSVAPLLREQLEHETGQLALESLWALHGCGELTEADALRALNHVNPHVRRWTVRLFGDRGEVTAELARSLARLARTEPDAEVRSQLASSAKRLPTAVALTIIGALWTHDDDANDPHIPLLLWWALEPRTESDRAAVLALFEDREIWDRPLVSKTILSRLTQRYAVAGGHENLLACARLLGQAPAREGREELLAGLEAAYVGRSAADLPTELREAISRAWASGATAGSLTLGLRLGQKSSVERAMKLIVDEKASATTRIECIRTFGEVDQPVCVPVLLKVLRESRLAKVREEVLAALQRYDDPSVPVVVLELLPRAAEVRGAALNLLASRPGWALTLVKTVDQGKIPAQTVPLEAVRKIQLHKGDEIARLLTKHWGRVRPGTGPEKQRETARLIGVLKGGKGEASRGRTVFTATCAKCHKLFGEGGDVGPDLTGYERDSAIYWLENIVDPSAAIREEYTTFIVQTTDGRTLTGIVAGQDKATVTLRDPEGRLTRVAREKIDDMRASPISLMPEGQLVAMSAQEVRDLFAYLMSKTPPRK
jgi:putative heme-binding domain-containing protein